MTTPLIKVESNKVDAMDWTPAPSPPASASGALNIDPPVLPTDDDDEDDSDAKYQVLHAPFELAERARIPIPVINRRPSAPRLL